MSQLIRGFSIQLENNLVLKIAENEDEIKEIGKFNNLIHNEELEEYIERLFLDHPMNKEMYWIYIYDSTDSKIISSLALLPTTWNYEGKKIKTAEMGFVGTLEEYRGKGLYGILNDYYLQILKEKDITLSVLRGIPHFYKKYDYGFALPADSGFTLATNDIPDDAIENIKVRIASKDDLPLIEKLATAYNEKYMVSIDFDKKSFEFRFMTTKCDEFNGITYIIDEDRKAAGFFTIGSTSSEEKADILIVSELTQLQMLKALQFVNTYNRGSIEEFNVMVENDSSFGKYLISLGCLPLKGWRWQIHIADFQKFITLIKPVLEKRLENTMYKNLTREIKLSNYETTIQLKFEDGKITEINSIEEFPPRDVDLRIPAIALPKLIMGDRTIDEISYILTDTLAKPDAKLIIETLFPKKSSFLTPYY